MRAGARVFESLGRRYKIGSPLTLLEYYHQKDMVVLITKSVIMAMFSLDSEARGDATS